MERFYSLGIVGTGGSLLSAGWQVAYQLLRQGSPVKEIYLTNRTLKKARGLKAYLEVTYEQIREQAREQTGGQVREQVGWRVGGQAAELVKFTMRPIINVCNLEEMLEAEPDIIFMAFDATPHARIQAYNEALDHSFRSNAITLDELKAKSAATWHDLVKEGVMNRRDLLEYNTRAVSTLAPCFADYKGLVLMYTNPVDVIVSLFLKLSGLHQEQVAGFNEGDSDRFRRVLLEEAQRSQPLLHLQDVDAFVLGPHNNHVVPVFSQARVYGEKFFDIADDLGLQHEQLYERLVGEAQRWFEILGSTSPELAYGVARVITGVMQRNTYFPTLSVHSPWQEDSFCIGQRVNLSTGTFKVVDTSLDFLEAERLVVARDHTRRAVKDAYNRLD